MPKAKSPWIHAWSDNVAGIDTFSQLMTLADIKDDGDYKLVVADQKGKLKIYMGTNVISNEKLGFEKPTALEVFYESTKKPQLPIIAIASGSSLFYYQNFQPISKFELPYIQFSPEEKEVWNQITKVTEEQEFVSLCDRLFAIRESGIAISTISSELLSLENALEQMEYARQNYTMLIQHQNFITCMTRINKSLDEEKAVSMLVIGTEQRNIFIMDQSGMSVKKQITLKSVPTFIQCIGQFDVEYRIYAACRDGKVYVTRQGEVTDQIFSIDSKPVGLLLFEKQIVVASMNNTLHSFFLKGKKNFTMNLPAGVVDIQKLEVKRTQQSTNGQCLIVALNNGELRLYNSKDKNLIHILKNEDLISGMSYGTFGREEGSLIINNKSGGISVKMLQRQANLSSTHKPGPPAEQDIPLNVPKKTKLFVELTQRERENAQWMHKQFQKDLIKLRLKTAKQYIQMLSDGLAPMSYAQGSQIRLSASCEGIGPSFKIKLQLQNLSKTPIMGVHVNLSFNDQIYKLKGKSPFMPMLVPNLNYKIDIDIENIDPSGASDVVKVLVFNKESTVPLITANISMPLSELNMEQM
ncbi:hypothetical protein FGO68_gene3820 [Halteria grandinella]|uniref:Bardet-Biedl syndrome 1 N-terminal domain-containing protein n=1 Tax=Halteria grandinella TaxID=5974 RepID=A0A8J8NT58_HALGN|nr:hypothetical protein FGO68_gene3820 [Halteria grandinella]